MKLKSKSLTKNSNIPLEFTCYIRKISPQLMWENFPEGTKSFAISVADSDFLRGKCLHWLVFGIPADARQIERCSLPDGTEEIVNNFSKKRYGGTLSSLGNSQIFLHHL